jgi:tRNA-uridine 2-sulfurtransferase
MNFDFDADLLQEYGIPLTHEQYLQNAQKTVVVGMSGGVDSSVAALLVKLQGYRAIGLFMKNWDETNPDGTCTADDDYQDVIKVAERLEMPYYSVNFVKEYWDGVFQEFLSDYRAGLTPNPDVLCNREIKFKVFYQRARLLGADYLATGHYCQLEKGILKKGADLNKDQTYFLYAVERSVFQNVLFPIGHLPKPKVRELAARFELATMAKKDSTGICFIGERNFKDFLSQYVESVKGNFLDLSGKVLGRHDGTCFYTLGQRKGLGLGGPGEAWFVVAKNHAQNEVIVAQGQDHPALYADGLTASELNWLTPVVAREFRCKAKIRYRQQEQDCTVRVDGDKVSVIFDAPMRAMTPRQSVVFYQNELCVGGGMIDEIMPNYHVLGRGLPEVLSVQV